MEINELIEALFKEKTIAYLNRYQEGQLHYRFEVNNECYEFPIDIIQTTRYMDEGFGHFVMRVEVKLAEDIGNTPFKDMMRASELTRWIKKNGVIKLTE